ncbi:hypothetical protein SAMD00019534_108020 [Acytostelium subglobosum LB1]|uniref:hypothetical protein n=1 Tax=Acytostelium subglobosum LB1 TaxID=1410327 RepID=UPI000644827C|nr:hypothetical protein SAMD00019534_108020 [Acytostelium subglobosum LB1]GAM27626.1 hypothetical protein SAMD00019534_108020 [Acytostelium subglobosum LB1]|eukprot:XP_012749285.1 hypothetical protein SAMD00019534_108020 [Acytostelium subglobosum LB1]
MFAATRSKAKAAKAATSAALSKTSSPSTSSTTTSSSSSSDNEDDDDDFVTTAPKTKKTQKTTPKSSTKTKPAQQSSSYANTMRKYFLVEAAKIEGVKKRSAEMKKYMRDQFDYLGLRGPIRKATLKEFIKQHGHPEDEDLLPIYMLPEREFTYCAMEMAIRGAKKGKEDRLDLYLGMANHQPWWDTIDFIASNLVGTHLQLYPDTVSSLVDEWIVHESMWIRRIALLFQLKYKKQTDVSLLFKCIDATIHEKEFFIQKAIGWSLREYSKTDKKMVKGFVDSRPNISNLSKREALKHH